MKKLLPLVLLLIGAGAGVGAGILLRPDAPLKTEVNGEGTKPSGETGEEGAHESSIDKKENSDSITGEVGTNEYVKLSNQFVVPIVADGRVVALVVLALSIEVPAGKTEMIYQREPKLRDSFLQILFDHANIGGFEGNFTNAEVLGRLRMALKEVGQRDLGQDIVKDVLIIEIARQDY